MVRIAFAMKVPSSQTRKSISVSSGVARASRRVRDQAAGDHGAEPKYERQERDPFRANRRRWRRTGRSRLAEHALAEQRRVDAAENDQDHFDAERVLAPEVHGVGRKQRRATDRVQRESDPGEREKLTSIEQPQLGLVAEHAQIDEA